MNSRHTVQSRAWRGTKLFGLVVVLVATILGLGLGVLIGVRGSDWFMSSGLVLGVIGFLGILVLVRPQWGAFVLLWQFFFNDLLADFATDSSLVSIGKFLGMWVLMMWVISRIVSRRTEVYVGAVGWLGLALMGLVLLSGLVNEGDWPRALLLLGPGLAFYILIVNQLESWRDWEAFGTHLILIAIATGMNLFLRLWLAADTSNLANLRLETVMEKSSVLNNPNSVALYLASVVPLVIARLRQRGRWNAVLWIIAVLLILGVVATSSRGGTLALGAVLFVLSLRHWEARLLLLAGVILVLVIAPLLPTVGYLYDRFRLTDSSTYTSTVLRLNAFQTGLRMGLDKPLLGTGPFLWADLVDQYAVDAFQGVAASSHSIWVQAFSELGVTGLLLTMALFGAGVWRLWCVWRVPSQSRRAESRKWAILAFALGYIVAVTFLNLLYSRTLFMILGYVVAFAQLRGKGFLLGEEALDSGV